MPSVVYDVREGRKFTGDTDLVAVTCSSCHITYAIPESLKDSALKWRGDRSDGRGWKLCCPMGHTWWYVGETDLQREKRIRKQTEERAQWAEQRLRAERDLREDTERRLSAQKGATTRAKRRHAAGVCPCCHRSFKQLRDHMATKHPDYDPGNGTGHKPDPKPATTSTEREQMRAVITKRWAEGKLVREIAEELGVSKVKVGNEMHAMRAAGYDLPKRPPWDVR
jgi:hypothetical protein